MLEQLKKLLKQLNENVEAELITEAMETEITTLFEAAVGEKVTELVAAEKAKLEESAEAEKAKLEESSKEELRGFKEELVDAVDRYMAFVAEAYIKENKAVLEEGIRADFRDSLVESVVKAFATHGVDVKNKDALRQVVESANTEITGLEKQLNDMTDRVAHAEKALVAERAMRIFDEETANLDDEGTKRAFEICESFDVDDAEAFRSKVAVVAKTIKGAAAEPRTVPRRTAVVESVSTDSAEPFKPDSGENKDLPADVAAALKYL